MQNLLPPTNKTASNFVNSKLKKCNRKSKRRRRRQQKQQESKRVGLTSGGAAYSSYNQQNSAQSTGGVDIWKNAYENAIRCHNEHQVNFWRQIAERLMHENTALRMQLEEKDYRSGSQSTNLPDYETSEEDSDLDDETSIVEKTMDVEIDPDYLDFIEITHRHREELRLKRKAELLRETDKEADPAQAKNQQTNL